VTTPDSPTLRNANKWVELVTSLVQAPVGLATSQADRIIAELVRTGNLGQREAERLLGELRSASERAQGRAQQESARLDRFIESRIEDVLNRVNIPSRSDIERLNNSVDVLTAKVEALVGSKDRGGAR
jgi:poly(hydroxyalkanoate) granule-associated protein